MSIFIGGIGSTNELDDFEEGTFTASVTGGASVSQTFDSTGRYTKIGRLVHVEALIQVTLTGNGSDVTLGLPFACANVTSLGGGIIHFTNVTGLGFSGTNTVAAVQNTSNCKVFRSNNKPTIDSSSLSNRAIYYVLDYHTE